MWLYIPGKSEIKEQRITKIIVEESGGGIQITFEGKKSVRGKMFTSDRVTIKAGAESEHE